MKPIYYAILALAFAVAASGCGKRTETVTVKETVTQTVQASDSVQSLVDEENSYRLSQGQTMLSQGLSCTVQQVASGQWLSSSSPGYNAGQGVVVLTGTNYAFLNKSGFSQADTAGGNVNSILPSAIQSLFVNQNYKINCTGFIVIEYDGYTAFELSSDDGSILTVDGTQIINNDGNHAIQTKSGSKLMRRGVKSFTLSYAQTGGGNFALLLKKDGELAPGAVFYH